MPALTVRLGIVEYRDIYADGLNSTKVWGWHNTVADFKQTMSKLYASGGGDIPETKVDALEAARRMDYRSFASKFIVTFTDASTKNGSNYENIVTIEDVTHKLIGDRICVSVVSPTSTQSQYKILYESTTGIWANIYSNFYAVLTQLADRISSTTMDDGVWIRLSNGTAVKLKKYPDKSDLITDTDEDGIPDSKELIDEVEISIAMTNGPSYKFKAWTFKTNPSKADTDDDGIIDPEDDYPCTPDGIVNLTVNPLEGNATQPFEFAADVAPKLKDKFDYILLQFRLPGGAWIQSKDILASDDYIGRFSMGFSNVVGDSEPERKGFSRYKKTIWILDPGLEARQGLRYFRVIGIYKDRTQRPFTSAEMSFVVNSTAITLSGLTKSVLDGTHNFTLKMYDNNVKKIGIFLKGDTSNIPYNIPEQARYSMSTKEIGTINPYAGIGDYTYALNTTQFSNGKYELYAKAFDSKGNEMYESYHKEFTIKNTTFAPEFSVMPGWYNEKQIVKLSSKSAGSYLYYTTDGTKPTLQSTRYDDSKGIVVDKTMTIKAFAWNVKYDVSVVAEAKYTIDLTALPSGDWNYQKLDERIRFLSDNELNGSKYKNSASANLTRRLRTINSKIEFDWEANGETKTSFAKKYLARAGSKAPIAYNTEVEVVAALKWTDSKIEKLYIKGAKYQKYGLDQRMLLAIICQEGTGSFNTNPEVLDSYGGHYIQPDFEKDIAAAMETQAVRKLNAYKHYWKDFISCINNLSKTYNNANITKGNGNLYQFINYCTLGATIENDAITKISTMGMYAEDNDWWTKVKTIFEGMVDNNGTNAGEKYSEYIKTIKTPIKTGYELPRIKFVETYNGKVWSDQRNTWLSGYSLITAVLQSTSSPSSSVSFPLKYGMKADNTNKENQIYQVQTFLNNNLSIDVNEMLALKVDSDYGRRTIALVKLYQKQNDPSNITGEVSEKTFNILRNGTWKISKPGKGEYVLRGVGADTYYEWIPSEPSQWEQINKSRNDLVNKAKELLTYHNGDPVHYFWGGKYMNKYGYNPNWGKVTKVSSTKNWSTGKNVPLGLDCSGFTNWVSYQITGINIGEGTDAQMTNLKKISRDELKPGDIGFTDGGGHVGIYIGKNSNGDQMFIHAAPSQYGTPLGYVIDKNGKTIYPSILDELRKFNTAYTTGKITISLNNKKGNDDYIKKSAQFVITKGTQDVVVPLSSIKAIKKSNGEVDKLIYTDAITKKEYVVTIKEVGINVQNPGTTFSKFYRIKVNFLND